MLKANKTAVYFIMAFASFQCWLASVLPFRGDEAYFFLKSVNLAWFDRPHPGISALLLNWVSKIGDNHFILRLPSVLAMSFATVFVYKSALLLGGCIGGWTGLLLFILTPAVAQGYITATPAPYLILFSAVTFFFWIKAFQTDKINYFIGAGAASGLAVFTHSYGYFLICMPILYTLIFNKKILFEKNFIMSLIFFSVCPTTLFAGKFLGYPIVPGEIPFIFTEHPMFLLGLSILSVPIIIYVLEGTINSRFKIRELNFLNISFLFGIFFIILLNLVSNFDFRYAPAFLMPVFILTGAFFARKDNKMFLGTILIISVFLTTYLNIGQKENLPMPTGIKASAVYQAIDAPLSKILTNSGAIFALTSEKASLYAFNTKIKIIDQNQGTITQIINFMIGGKSAPEKIKHPEACLPKECSQRYGAFISENEDNGTKYFTNSDYYGIFRLTTPKDGTKSFKVYTVIDNAVP